MWMETLFGSIELWQIPVVIGALVLALAYPIAWFAEGWRPPTKEPSPPRLGRTAATVRTSILVVLSVVLLGVLVVTFQSWELSSSAANVAVVASLTLEGFAMRLTYLSYREQKKLLQSPVTPSPSPNEGPERQTA